MRCNKRAIKQVTSPKLISLLTPAKHMTQFLRAIIMRETEYEKKRGRQRERERQIKRQRERKKEREGE